MKRTLIIARLTGLEFLRDRVLHGLVVVFVLISLFSLVLGQLSFAEQIRITLDFAFSVMHISVAALAILLGAQAVQKDIDRKTIYMLLSRPLRRREYFLGKFLGLLFILAVIIVLCSLALFLTLTMIGGRSVQEIIYAGFGMFLEAMILSALVFLLSQKLKPAVTIFSGVGLFLVGHWIETLKGLTQKSSSGLTHFIYESLIWFVPNLEKWNWKALVIYGDYPMGNVFYTQIGEAFLWALFYFLLALWMFERRELVS